MPTISAFFGILIRMYLGAKEHDPPHIHCYYEKYSAVFLIQSGEMLEGDFSPRQRKLVEAWIEIHREELFIDWRLASSGELPLKIDPLK